MYNLSLILLLIAVSNADCKSTTPPKYSSSDPNPDGEEIIDHLSKKSYEQEAVFGNEPPPVGYRSGVNCKPNKTSLTAYPHFVRVEVTQSYSQINTVARQYPIFGALHGVVISKNYVLWSGSMCDKCTYMVQVGEGGGRLKAKPIPYSVVRNDKTDSKALILLELENSIKFGSTIKPAQLPTIVDTPKTGKRGILVGPTLNVGIGSIINLSKRIVLNQQDCNIQMAGSIKKWSYQVISPPGPWEDVTTVPKDSFCAVDAPESACPVVDSPVLFIKGKLSGIQYHEVYVFVGSDGSVDYQYYYDIAYYRAWIKNVTGA